VSEGARNESAQAAVIAALAPAHSFPATTTAGDTATLAATLVDTNTGAPLANRPLELLLNGQVVGTATTDADGLAMLDGVSVAVMLPGHFGDAVSVRFAGDAAGLPGNGSAALDIFPALDMKRHVRVRRETDIHVRHGTVTVELEITNSGDAGALIGLFAIELSNLTPGVTLKSATVTVHGEVHDLTITYDAGGNPIINVPASVASRLPAGRSLPTITLALDKPEHGPVHFDTEVFLDPLGS
jgi:hypothetical protein